MAGSTNKQEDVVPGDAAPVQANESDHLEDEEKILDGRRDVNYPALLTKDVPGG